MQYTFKHLEEQGNVIVITIRCIIKATNSIYKIELMHLFSNKKQFKFSYFFPNVT